MSLDPERQEQLRSGIATTLGRLRGDVIPLPVASSSQAQERSGDGLADPGQAAGHQGLRADPEMKTAASGSGGDLEGLLSGEPASEDQPDLLSGLEPPQLLPPLTEEEQTERDRRKGRRRMLAAAAALILIGAAGYWLLGGDSSDEVPLITADLSPEKVKPAEEGGLDVPNQDIAILENPTSADTNQSGETILPAPEQPLPAEMASGIEPAPAEPALVEEPAVAAASQGESEESVTSVEQLIMAAPEAPELPPVDVPALEAAADGAEASATTAPSAPEMPAVPEMPTAPEIPGTAEQTAAIASPDTVPSEDNAVETAATETPAATEAAPAELGVQLAPVGDVRVQLAAVKSEDAARSHWAKLQSRYGSLLSGLDLTVERVDKGTAGIFYRVQAGPLSDRASGKTLCAELKKQNQDCIVVK